MSTIFLKSFLVGKLQHLKSQFTEKEELEKNKFKYYTLLNNLRTENPKWKEWILFFLDSVIKQSNRNIEKLRKIEELYSILNDYCKKNNIKRSLFE